MESLTRLPARWQPLELAGNDWVSPADFPLEALPLPFSSFARELARSLDRSPNLTGAAVLGAVMVAAQGGFVVAPKPTDSEWTEVLALWLLVAAESGGGKSEIWSRARKPIEEWEQDERNRLAPVIEEAKAKVELYERQKRSNDEQEVAAAARALANIRVPVAPRCTLGEFTPDAIPPALARHGAATVWQSEGSGIIEDTLGRFTNAKFNHQSMLDLYSGQRLEIDRKGEGSVAVPRHSPLGKVISIQPAIVPRLRQIPHAVESGYLARFDIIRAPDRGIIPLDRPPVDHAAREQYAERVRAILGCRVGAGEPKRRVRFSSGAFDAFSGYTESLRRREPETRCDALANSYLKKRQGVLARLAAVLHIAEHGERSADLEVTPETFTRALSLADFLRRQSEQAHACALAADPSAFLEKALRVLQGWVKKGHGGSTRAQLRRAVKRSMVAAERADFDAAYGRLLRMGALRPTERAHNNDLRSEPFEIHPDLASVPLDDLDL